MRVENEFEIRMLKMFDEIHDVFLQYASYFPNTVINNESFRRCAEKVAAYGVCFAIYLDGELLGYMSGYANSHETKCAHGNMFAISREAGLLRGVIWKKLFYTFMTYAKSQGMEYCTGQVGDWNTYAREQYLALGAEVIGRDDEYSCDWIKFDIQEVLDKLDSAESNRICD